MKLAILGEKKSILGFGAVGVAVYGVTEREDLRKIIQEIQEKEYAILFITEEIAENFADELEKLYKKTLPAVLVIPGVRGKTKKGIEVLKKIIERALGSEMFKI